MLGESDISACFLLSFIKNNLISCKSRNTQNRIYKTLNSLKEYYTHMTSKYDLNLPGKLSEQQIEIYILLSYHINSKYYIWCGFCTISLSKSVTCYTEYLMYFFHCEETRRLVSISIKY